MAIDTAKKRRAAAGVGYAIPSVTPDSAKDELWRASAAGSLVPAYVDSLPSVLACSVAVGAQLEAFETVTNAFGLAETGGQDRIVATLQAPGYASMTGVCFRLQRTGTPGGSIKVVVHTDDGGKNVYDDPPDFEGPEYDPDTISTSAAWYWFPVNVILSGYTNVTVGLQIEGGDASNYIDVYGDSLAGDADAVGGLIDFPSTVIATADIAFRLYGNLGAEGPRGRGRLGRSRASGVIW